MQRTLGIVCLLLILVGCESDVSDSDSNPRIKKNSNRVVAVSYALKYLTARIAGDDLQVEFPMPADADPTTWRPSIDEIQRMQTADLVVANGEGVRYAGWLDRVSLNDSKICNSAMALELDDFILVEDHAIVHKHGKEGEHSHPFLVPYIWLNPATAKKQAARIHERMAKVYPEHADNFQSRFDQLVIDLDKLDQELQSFDGKEMVVVTLNPNFKFLTRAAKINDQHLLVFAADDVNENMERLQAIQEANEVSAMIVPGGFDVTKIDSMLSKQKLKVVEIDLLDREIEGEDYISASSRNIRRLKAILK